MERKKNGTEKKRKKKNGNGPELKRNGKKNGNFSMTCTVLTHAAVVVI